MSDGTRIIEIGRTAGVKQEGSSLELEMVSYARVWPEDTGRRGKPVITLVGDSFADVARQVALWAEAGEPSKDEAMAMTPQAESPRGME